MVNGIVSLVQFAGLKITYFVDQSRDMKTKICLLAVLLILAGCFSGLISCQNKPPLKSSPAALVRPRVIQTLPHDSLAFTQGLFFDNGLLYESTGLYGQSTLRVLDAKNGACMKKTALTDDVFAEGCARLGNKLLQLTWKEHIAVVYSFPDLMPQRTTAYAGEGWGLTADSVFFYMSNGSDTITVRDSSFGIVRRIPVRLRNKALGRLNELEYARGKIFANVWYNDTIYAIDPATGSVTNIIDCSEIIRLEQPGSTECVLNGIGYDKKSGRFFITGKNWRHIFVVAFDKFSGVP